MIYTPEEKRHLDAIAVAFDSYIKEAPEMDVLYSEKSGYTHFWFTVDSAIYGCHPRLSATSLLLYIYDEIVYDVRDLFLCGEHDNSLMYPVEFEEAKRRIMVYIERLPKEYQSHAKAAINFYFVQCKEMSRD